MIFMGRAVKLQVFLKRRADGGLQIVRVERARAGEGLGESLFPRGEQRRLLPKDRSPAGGLERIDELVLVHPLLPRELIFRGKNSAAWARRSSVSTGRTGSSFS